MTTAPTSQTMLYMATPLKLDADLICCAACGPRSHAGEASSDTRRFSAAKTCAIEPVIGSKTRLATGAGNPMREGRNLTFSHPTAHVCTVVAAVRLARCVKHRARGE